MIMKYFVFILSFLVYFSEYTVARSVKNRGNNDGISDTSWYYTLRLNGIDMTQFENIKSSNESEDFGEPLYLTSYIESGKIEEARKKAFVQHPDLENLTSYSGYLTIDKNYDSNTFFWFIQSETDPVNDPVMLWMIGGPGSTILASVMVYNGPFHVNDDFSVKLRQNTYTTNHSIIYIDNPMGSGYSFTNDINGLRNNSYDVADDVVKALMQFFKLFPEYKGNKFYVGGDSYAGKFVITVSDAIRVLNEKETDKINLSGLVIGNGIIHPHKQAVKADFLYNVGLFSKKARDLFKPIEEKPSGQRKILSEIFINYTGFTYNQNILERSYPLALIRFYPWSQLPSVRKAMHVGNNIFELVNITVLKNTKDLGQPVTSILEKLMDEYKVLFYIGQLDAHITYTGTVDVFKSLNWSGAEEFKTAAREKIYINNELAGYRKIVKKVHEVMIRNAGHVASFEQREWCSNILTQFTHG